MNPVLDYIHQRRGYRMGVGCCRIRVYRSGEQDAPVVLCSELPRGGNAELAHLAGYLAAEVVRDWFPEGLPELVRPLLWIEHRPPRKNNGPGRHALLDFPDYTPRPEGAGFVRRVTLGVPTREPLTTAEVAVLTGGEIGAV